MKTRQTTKSRRRKYKFGILSSKPWQKLLFFVVYVCILTLWNSKLLRFSNTGQENAPQFKSRKLLDLSLLGMVDGEGCGAESTLKQYGLLLWLPVGIFLFAGVAMLCDDYLADCLQVIVDKLEISGDVAGATFLALGSSAPEIFISLVGVFFYPDDNPGPSTVIGSAVFNICCIVGCTCLFAPTALKVSPWPIVRDWSVYCVSIGLLYIVLRVNTPDAVDLSESAAMSLLYCSYVVVMLYNNRINTFLEKNNLLQGLKGGESANLCASTQTNYTAVNISNDPGTPESALSAISGGPKDAAFQLAGPAEASAGEPDADNDDDNASSLAVFMLPWKFMFACTIPNPERSEHSYITCFLSCIVWIGVMSFVMIDLFMKIGDCLFIPVSVTGLTLMTLGASLPDLIASVTCGRRGEADMAISNAMGSNIINVTIGLGGPFLLSSLIYGHSVFIHFKGAGSILTWLFGILIFYMVYLRYQRFKVNKRTGQILLAIYTIFITYVVIHRLHPNGHFYIQIM